jgi:type IV secretion system protein VirD4
VNADPASRTLGAIGVVLAWLGVVWLAAAMACVPHGAPLPTLAATADALPRLILHPSLGPAAWTPALQAGPFALWTSVGIVHFAIGLCVGQLYRSRRPAPFNMKAAGLTRHLRALTVGSTHAGRLSLGRQGHRLLAAERDASLAVIGPTGCGKTVALAIPALLEWAGPVLAASVKTDLLSITGAHRTEEGDVQVYDPGGDGDAGWDPVHHATTWHDAQRLASWVCDAARPTGSSLSESDYWITQAAKALAPHLYVAAHAGASIDQVVAWIDTQEETALYASLQASPHPDAALAQQHLHALWMKDERLRSSVYATVEAVLLPYADPGAQAAARLPKLDFDRWLTGNNTIYLVAPSHEQARLRPIFTVIAQAALRAAYARANSHGGRLAEPCLVLLDEAGNIAPLPDLATYATTARSHGITLVTVWQDLAQLRARYGTSAATVLSNHRARVFGAGIADDDTLRYLSTLIGDARHEEPQHSTDLSNGRRSRSEHVTWRPAAPTDAIRRMSTNTALLLYGNEPAAHLQLQPWFQNRRLRGRVSR